MESNLDLWQRGRRAFRQSILWVYALIVALGLTLILSFQLFQPSDVIVTLNEPAAAEIVAPYTHTFTSEVLTEQARADAAKAVSDQYTALDLNIGRTQLNLASQMFNYIDTIRADSQANQARKIQYLQAIQTAVIDELVAADLLAMNEAEYTVARQEVLDIIDTVMRQEIKESQLRDAQRAARLQASLNLTRAQENVVTNLAPQFIVPNVFLDEVATQAKRTEATTAVQPIARTVYKGQVIIQAGKIVDAADLELLTELGLLQVKTNWRTVVSTFLSSLLAMVIISLFWQQFEPIIRQNTRYLAAMGSIIWIFALLAKLLPTGTTYILYWYPLAAMAMLLAVIYDEAMSIVVTVVMAGLIGFNVANSLELTIYYAAGGLLAALTLRDAQRVNAFFRAGVVAAVGYITVIVIFRLTQDIGTLELLQILLYGLANGVLSAALTLVGFFALGSIFKMTTTLQLQELSRLDHPLLQELLRRAPGTYHHSIMVANLAEQAADRIKAQSTLVRVGAFYHDIGKMNNPSFFTENQEGHNPHDSIGPERSAEIIVSHVTDGLELARRYKLPDRIRDFIAEHHGRRLVRGFYLKAVEQAGGDETQVDESRYRYPGPRPQSRESGIVMLADAVEATSSALRPNTEKAIEKLVTTIIQEDLREGQLNNSGLTLGDIQMIRESFIEALKGRFHVRVRYPGNEEMEDGEIPQIEAPNAPLTLPPPPEQVGERVLTDKL
ncbi:MAG: HDIG domain-containing protein [Chloroflexi bacterium]|nr:HDIG domain-containing protein [Chloroflexota bacterium]MBK8932180.1 HDIG domain-containing protein [Chloroflexota bacterium]MBP6802825.1 HDIG domain-containing protein [Chloroflexota bacterium]MBP7591850.1 HDIG domain-containing protein [Chloroflexota bacterium]